MQGLAILGKSRRHWRNIAILTPFLAIMIFLFGLPSLRMLARSILEPTLNFTQFGIVLGEPLYQQIFLTTLRISVLVTLLSVLLAFPVAHFANRTSPLLRNITFAIVLVPFWTSLLVRVYGWTFLLQRTGVINNALQSWGLSNTPLKLLYTEGAVILGITHYMLPFMIFSIYASLRSIDPRLPKAAATMGARPLRVFIKVTLPLAMPGIVAGSILVFVGSLGFYVTPALMGSPSEMMIANLISFQIRETLDWPRASAVASILVVAVAVLTWLYLRFAQRASIGKALQ